MKKYNYFDDDDEIEIALNKKNILTKDELKKVFGKLKVTAGKTRDVLDEFVHDDVEVGIEELREFPNLRHRFLKILAVVMFVVFVLVFIIGFSHSITSQNKKNEQFYKDAGKVCSDYIVEFGSMKTEDLDSKTYGKDKVRLTGLCYARQMDFNNDGDDELMLVYNNKNAYTLEVWGYVDKKFSRIYSDSANSTKKETDGVWVSFYHRNNRYYICKSEKDSPENVTIYALKGKKFKKYSECNYDRKDDIYSFDGKINASDFETINLSAIKSSHGDYLIEIVSQNLDTFSTQSIANLENKKTSAQLKAEAYAEIIDDRIEKYGSPSVKSSEGKNYISGIAYCGLIDFNNDKNEELLLVYRKPIKKSSTDYYTGESITIEEPSYTVEMYNWNGTVAKKIFSKDTISNLFEDVDTQYLMLKKSNNTVDICTNYYNFDSGSEYTAVSKIYRLKSETVETVYNAKMEYNYGYRTYYLNGESSYSSEFETHGHKVPMFLNDDESYDSGTYTLAYFSGKSQDDLQAVADAATKSIDSIKG